MQLSDILEENSLKSIKDKTKIPEEYLEDLLALEFDALTKVKTLGFISILEREYKADLSGLKSQALEYYGQSQEEHLFPLGQLVMDEHRSKSKILILFILLLLVVSSWYFFTQFDKKHLNALFPFIDEQIIESFTNSDNDPKEAATVPELSIDSITINAAKKSEEVLQKESVTVEKEVVETHVDSVHNSVQKEENSTSTNI